MYFIESLLIALSLSVDAFVVSLIYSKRDFKENSKLKYALIISFSFGFFQFLMPLIGFLAGLKIVKIIESYDHYIAFCLLAFVGGKMLKDVFDKDKEEKKLSLSLLTILMLSIATSIDALAVGLSLSIITNKIFTISLTIGLVCTVASAFAFCAGQYLNRFKSLDAILNTIGGCVLIGIGIQILHTHNVF